MGAHHRAVPGGGGVLGGAMELGESLIGAAIREVEEETGVRVIVTGLVGI
ncbi:NUDIX domain-containing protein [Actinomycetospora sp. CA-084318]